MDFPSSLQLPRPTRLEWIPLLLGIPLLLWYGWFLDDACVYFRYVDNLLFLNHGLVYNAGEYVEGYSSPVWIVILIGLRATGLPYWLLTQLLGVLLFTVFWYSIVAANRMLSPRGSITVNAPLWFLCFNYGVLCYFTSGLETPLVQVCAALCALLTLRTDSKLLQVAVGLAPMVRHELLLPVVLIGWYCWRHRDRFPWALGLSFFVSAGAWGIFRVWYYADFFPSTFYLKDGGWALQGWRYLNDTLSTYHLVAFGFVFTVLASVLAYVRHPDAPARLGTRFFMLVMAATVALYVVRIGGDPRHYRYFAFPLPLAVIAAGGLIESAVVAGLFRWGRLLRSALPVALGVLTFLCVPPMVHGHPTDLNVKNSQVDRIADAAAHRSHPTLRMPRFGMGWDFEQRAAYKQFEEEHGSFEYTGASADFWCATSYKQFDIRIVHSLGLTDAILARADVVSERPAHKYGLERLARDMADLQRQKVNAPGPGLYREAVDRGVAPPWIANNIETIELIERKVYNRHRFWQNIPIAIRPVGRIKP